LYSPSKIPPVFNGTRMVAFGLFEDEVTSDYVLISAVDQLRQPLQWKVPIIHQSGNLINRLAAYHVITDLQRKTENGDADRDIVTKLGVQYQLATKYTSFVVVEERGDQVVSDSLITVQIKTILPLGGSSRYDYELDTLLPDMEDRTFMNLMQNIQSINTLISRTLSDDEEKLMTVRVEVEVTDDSIVQSKKLIRSILLTLQRDKCIRVLLLVILAGILCILILRLVNPNFTIGGGDGQPSGMDRKHN